MCFFLSFFLSLSTSSSSLHVISIIATCLDDATGSSSSSRVRRMAQLTHRRVCVAPRGIGCVATAAAAAAVAAHDASLLGSCVSLARCAFPSRQSHQSLLPPSLPLSPYGGSAVQEPHPEQKKKKEKRRAAKKSSALIELILTAGDIQCLLLLLF